jgi:hypothetical protein
VAGVLKTPAVLCRGCQAEAYRSQQKDKLKELELGGLVDFQTAAAAGGGGGGGEPATERQQQEDAGEASGDHHQQQQKDKGKKASSTAKLKGKQAAAAAAAAADGGEAFATFIVIGSRGDHYVIKITDDKRTCQCLDHRCVPGDRGGDADGGQMEGRGGGGSSAIEDAVGSCLKSPLPLLLEH